MKVDIKSLEINGIPYEWVKHRGGVSFEIANNQTLTQPLPEWCIESDGRNKIQFLLNLLNSAQKEDNFIQRNSQLLAWRLPFHFKFKSNPKRDDSEQWKLFKRIVKIHDFVKCFMAYIKQCSKVVVRSENSNTELLRPIVDHREILINEIQEITAQACMEFSYQYQEANARGTMKLPKIPKALARIVFNDCILYPILPALYALSILKKIYSNRYGGKEALLSDADIENGGTDFNTTLDLSRQTVVMVTLIANRFNKLLNDYIFCAYPGKNTKHFLSDIMGMVFGWSDDEIDEYSKSQEEKDSLFVRKDPLIPICNVRKLALLLGDTYGLSNEEIKELHQKLPDYLYSSQNSQFSPNISQEHQKKLEPVLKALRDVSGPRYYYFSNKDEIGKREKRFSRNVAVISGKPQKNIDIKEVRSLAKKYFQFWNPVYTVLFCYAPIRIELSGVDNIVPFGKEIYENLWDTVKNELDQKLSHCRADPDESTCIKPLSRKLHEIVSLGDSVDLLHDFLKNQSNTTDRDSSEAASSIAAKKLERVLNKYIHTKDDKALLALWGSCAKSQNNVNWLYCQLMTDAAKLVCRACIGIFYRAVFLECQDSDS